MGARGKDEVLPQPDGSIVSGGTVKPFVHIWRTRITLFYGLTKCLKSCQNWKIQSGSYSASGWVNTAQCFRIGPLKAREKDKAGYLTKL